MIAVIGKNGATGQLMLINKISIPDTINTKSSISHISCVTDIVLPAPEPESAIAVPQVTPRHNFASNTNTVEFEPANFLLKPSPYVVCKKILLI